MLAELERACVGAQLWDAEGAEAAEMRLEMRPEESALLAPLLLAVRDARRRVRSVTARASARGWWDEERRAKRARPNGVASDCLPMQPMP